MIKECDILTEKDAKTLRKTSKEVKFPMDEKDIYLLNNMIMYLRMSQDEEYAEKHNIRPGMGLAAIQLGIDKRVFLIA